jgi:hypothetical protein
MLTFDRDYYLAQNPDVAASGVDAEMHYRQYGYLEGRDPSPDFDTSYYLMHNPEVEALGVNPFDHYNSVGVFEGRDPKAGVDAAFQLSMGNSDIAPVRDEATDEILSFDTVYYIEAAQSQPIAFVVPMDVVNADVALDSDMVLPIDVAVEPILFTPASPAPDDVLADGSGGDVAFDATDFDDVMDGDDVVDVSCEALQPAHAEHEADISEIPIEHITLPVFADDICDASEQMYSERMSEHITFVSDDRRSGVSHQPIILTNLDVRVGGGLFCARASPKRVNVASIGVDVPRDFYASSMADANNLPFS